MASGSSTSKSDDQKHYLEKEAAQKEQNGASSLSSSSSKQMKYIAIVVLVIIVVMSAAMGMIWGVVKPKRPVYAIEYGVIADANISTPDYETLSGKLGFVMRSYNPNKKSTIYYKSMKIYNSYSENKTTVPVKRVEDFSQPPFNVTRIRFIVPVEISTAPGENVIEYLQHGRITVNISVKAEMRFRFGSWKSIPRPIGIYCQAAAVMLDHNFQTTDCYVDL